MSIHYTRREWLAALGAATVASRVRPLALATGSEPMQGAFMILSTPYTTANELHHEDLANQVDFLDRCGVHGFVWPQNGFVNLPDAGRVAGQDPNLGGCSRSTRHHVPFGERSGAERAVMSGS